uniref:RNA methyltransferase n=1 Tax=Erpetoichthys calabaricus TaxID=27687 RepID=A0A8C4TQH1_ERPCA
MAGPTNAEREDPGAAPYGNFINYYSFNPPENRLTLVPSDLLKEVGAEDGQTTLVLDVGCNSGVCQIVDLHNSLDSQRKRPIIIMHLMLCALNQDDIHYPTRYILITGSRGSAGANPSQHRAQGRKQTPGRAPAHRRVHTHPPSTHYGQFRIANAPNLHVFGLGGNPRKLHTGRTREANRGLLNARQQRFYMRHRATSGQQHMYIFRLPNWRTSRGSDLLRNAQCQ